MTDARAERAGHAGPPAALHRAVSLVQFVGIIGFVVAEVVQYVQHDTDGFHRATLINALVWLIGVNGIVTGSGHLFMPDPIAASIGWPQKTPWQWEVGLAGLSYGVMGVMCPAFDRSFWLATIVATTIFFVGAAVGHVRQLVGAHNLSPGNAGPILYTDVLIPAFVIILYFTF